MDVKISSAIRPSSSDLWFFAYLPLAISDGIATPLIPLLALQHFGASAFAVTIIIAASSLSQVPFTILWGNLSDRVAHRKYFLVGSFLATGVSLVLIALAHDLITYFWLNVVEGLASAASAPIGTMLLLETRHKRWWPTDIGLFGLISGVGTTVGLGLGVVWLFVIGWGGTGPIAVMTGLLILSGVLALLSAVIAVAWIEEPALRLDRRSLSDLVHLHRGVLERIRHFRTRVLSIIELTRSKADPLPSKELLFLASLGVMTVGFDMFYGPFPVFLSTTAKFGNAAVFVVYLGAAAASSALFVHSGRAVEHHSPKGVFLGSLGARFALMLLFLWYPVYTILGLGSGALVAWFTIINALMGVSWAFISTASTLFLVRLVGRAARGRALGLYNAVAGGGGLLGTVLGGYLFVTIGVQAAYALAAVTVGIGAVMLLPIPFHVFQLPHLATRRQWNAQRAVGGRPPVRPVAPVGAPGFPR